MSLPPFPFIELISNYRAKRTYIIIRHFEMSLWKKPDQIPSFTTSCIYENKKAASLITQNGWLVSLFSAARSVTMQITSLTCRWGRKNTRCLNRKKKSVVAAPRGLLSKNSHSVLTNPLLGSYAWTLATTLVSDYTQTPRLLANNAMYECKQVKVTDNSRD